MTPIRNQKIADRYSAKRSRDFGMKLLNKIWARLEPCARNDRS